jgi:hypothetical protein
MKPILAAAALALLSASPAGAEPPRVVNPGTPAPDCVFHVNYDRNADLPGYRSGPLCLPFMPTNQLIPEGKGPEFYIEHFSDAALRRRWPACLADPACHAAALADAKPFIAYEPRLTGRVDPGAAVDPEGDLDLRSIRRPGYFAAPAYNEPIARAENRTHTVEFTVPRDSYERLHLQKQGTIKLRGWYLEGAGVGGGPRRRALVILNNGGGSELTAIDDPRSSPVRTDAAGRSVLNPQPDGLSEQFGMRHWRGFAGVLNDAGFDVLVTDRRGNGISGGVAGFNTAEQARDMFRELDQMETGDGLRLLTPSGAMLAGHDAAGRLMAGLRATEIPVVLAGYSRGSYAVAWAMHKNFVEDCDRDVPDGACGPALGRPNIKGAILYGPNSAGLGYRVAGHDMVEAALRLEYNTTYYLDSDDVREHRQVAGADDRQGHLGLRRGPGRLAGSLPAGARAERDLRVPRTSPPRDAEPREHAPGRRAHGGLRGGGGAGPSVRAGRPCARGPAGPRGIQPGPLGTDDSPDYRQRQLNRRGVRAARAKGRCEGRTGGSPTHPAPPTADRAPGRSWSCRGCRG